MLYKLLSRLDRTRYEPTVITLIDGGPLLDPVRALGVNVSTLGMRRGKLAASSVFRLAKWLHTQRPHVVQTWLYHSDLIGGIAAKLAGNRRVVWNIRHSVLDPALTKRSTIMTARVCARLSRRLPDRIICCSEASREVHAAMGYAPQKMIVIPNGFDLDTFRPDTQSRDDVRMELGLPRSTTLIGLVGRFDPQKDHRTFVQAAGTLHRRAPDVHFLLCGDGIDWENRGLVDWIDEAGVRGRCHLLGRRKDMPRIQASLDIATSSSTTEGFPNVVGEAMACAVPCVVTDVGESARIVGDTGRVIRPRDPVGLAEAWLAMLELPGEERARLGASASQRIATHFDLPSIASRYQAVYDEIATR